MQKTRKIIALFSLLIFLATAVVFAAGQKDDGAAPAAEQESVAWPSKPVTIVSSSRAGGFADVHARILAEYLQRKTGVAFAVVNKTEGAGTAGAEFVRYSEPDGLNLYYYHTSFPISCYTGVYNADPDKDFTPVSSVVNAGYNAFVVRADAPWDTLDELVNDARKRPNEIIWGSMAGVTSHFMMSLLEQEAGVKFKMVDAGSNAEKVTMLLGGHIDVCNTGMANADQYSKAGKMKVLAVVGDQRDPTYSDFPTTVEQGYETVVWNGEFVLYGPAGMSPELVAEINNVLDDFGTTDQISKDALTKQGAWVISRSTEESTALIKETHQKLKSIAAELGF